MIKYYFHYYNNYCYLLDQKNNDVFDMTKIKFDNIE
jgi:hypothetical protein